MLELCTVKLLKTEEMKNLSKFAFVLLMLFGVQAIAQEKAINQNQLPGNAQAFISEYFNDVKVTNVIKDSGIIKTEYEVYLSDGSKLEFDGKGNWKEVKSKGKSLSGAAFIPQSIRDYAAKNFPSYQIKKIEKGSRKYEVKLSNGLELEFDLNGNFLRIDD